MEDNEVLIYRIANIENVILHKAGYLQRMAISLHHALTQAKSNSPAETFYILLNEYKNFCKTLAEIREKPVNADHCSVLERAKGDFFIFHFKMLEKYPTLTPSELSQALDKAIRPHIQEIAHNQIAEIYNAQQRIWPQLKERTND